MVVEFKMIGRCFNSAVARFAPCVNISPGNVAVQSKSLNDCIKRLSRSKCSTICNNSVQQSHSLPASHRNLTQRCFDAENYTKNCLSTCSSGLLSQENCASPKSSYDDLLFRQFDSRTFDSPYLLQANKNAIEYLKGLPKSFFFRKSDGKKPKRRIPKLILVQNPFTWLMIKIDFSVLRSIWDPSFTEKDFKYGTKQAISRVTNIISEGQFTELNGLLTKAARLSLMRELDRNWSEKQRSLLSLHHDDIQISSPRKVYFIRIADKKYCDVDMAFLALKWAPINSIEALIFTEIFARFHREYTPHSIPEWTIAYFKVTRFEVLRKKPQLT